MCFLFFFCTSRQAGGFDDLNVLSKFQRPSLRFFVRIARLPSDITVDWPSSYSVCDFGFLRQVCEWTLFFSLYLPPESKRRRVCTAASSYSTPFSVRSCEKRKTHKLLSPTVAHTWVVDSHRKSRDIKRPLYIRGTALHSGIPRWDRK